MIPKEKLDILYKNPINRLFYKEYNNKCNNNILSRLIYYSEDITLYEPLNSYKFHSYSIINHSVLHGHFYQITNINQYNYFNGSCYTKSPEKVVKNFYYLIFNKFFVTRLLQDKKNLKYLIENYQYLFNFEELLIKSLKYNIINYDLINFYKSFICNKNINYDVFIYDYFYLNKKIFIINSIKDFLSIYFTQSDCNIIHNVNNSFILNIKHYLNRYYNNFKKDNNNKYIEIILFNKLSSS